MDSRFITETTGLLCNRAVLPGSSFATADVVGNYMGVAERWHTPEHLFKWIWSFM